MFFCTFRLHHENQPKFFFMKTQLIRNKLSNFTIFLKTFYYRIQKFVKTRTGKNIGLPEHCAVFLLSAWLSTVIFSLYTYQKSERQCVLWSPRKNRSVLRRLAAFLALCFDISAAKPDPIFWVEPVFGMKQDSKELSPKPLENAPKT